MSHPRFLLASASPRRRELLRLLNLPFEVLPTDIDETPQPLETPTSLVMRLSRLKAKAARSHYPDMTVIAADTDVELDGAILGKPRDRQEARSMLRALRGRAHTVHGGITLAAPNLALPPGARGGGETFVVHTRVWMRDYSEAEIEAYVATGDPLDKAAAYAVQHHVFRPVARVEGCFANVMGLALCRLHNALALHYPLREPCLECHLHPDTDCTVARLVAEGKIAGA